MFSEDCSSGLMVHIFSSETLETCKLMEAVLPPLSTGNSSWCLRRREGREEEDREEGGEEEEGKEGREGEEEKERGEVKEGEEGEEEGEREKEEKGRTEGRSWRREAKGRQRRGRRGEGRRGRTLSFLGRVRADLSTDHHPLSPQL